MSPEGRNRGIPPVNGRLAKPAREKIMLLKESNAFYHGKMDGLKGRKVDLKLLSSCSQETKERYNDGYFYGLKARQAARMEIVRMYRRLDNIA